MMNNKTKILFVCLGNICRSAAANGVMEDFVEREGLSDKIIIDSAGTYGGHAGELPDPRMRVAASRRGYNLTHRSRRIKEDDFYNFDRNWVKHYFFFLILLIKFNMAGCF